MANTDANIAVRVGADISPLQRDLKGAKRELKGFGRSAQDLGKTVAIMGGAAAAAAAAFGAVAIASANSAREISNLARISGTSAEGFQILARQTRAVGVEQEQLGDILKDTREKMGEFVATGGGGFADFAKKFGLSSAEVKQQFGDLTGPQILGKMETMLNAVNTPLEEQIFFFESVASESSKLIPIFKDLNTAGGNVAESMRAVILSDEELESLQEMGSAFTMLADNAGALIDRFIAFAAPVITDGLRAINDELVDLNDNVLPATRQNLEDIKNTLGNGEDDEWITIGRGLMPFELSDVEGYLDAIHEIYGNHYSAINQLSRAHANTEKGIVLGSVLDIAKSLEGQSKKAFEFMKAVRISEAVINGYSAATAAWKQGMEIGGPPVAAAFTAASLIRTGVLINSIRSTGHKGGSGGGAGGGGGASVAAEGQEAAPQRQQTAIINLEGEIFGRDQVRGLITQINDALDEGYQLRVN